MRCSFIFLKIKIRKEFLEIVSLEAGRISNPNSAFEMFHEGFVKLFTLFSRCVVGAPGSC